MVNQKLKTFKLNFNFKFMMRSQICSFIFLHIRNHGVETPENFLDLTVRIHNAWNNGNLNDPLYPSYKHQQIKGKLNLSFQIKKLL